MRYPIHGRALLAGIAATLAWSGPGRAMAQEFDLTRAAVNDSTVFAPFVVTETSLLRQALADGSVDSDTRILVFEAAGTRVALVTAQMAYHHAAQGEIAGEPWMVSF